jgi:hypothetical protein
MTVKDLDLRGPVKLLEEKEAFFNAHPKGKELRDAAQRYFRSVMVLEGKIKK